MAMTPPPAQRGAALLMAMIIVTLVATLASAMVWQQWRAVQVEAAERGRVQSAWILSGALDWARLILREDRRTGAVDHLGEPWAVPLAEARLSSFLATDKSNTEDGPEAFLSGSITDAQSRYNLRNLVGQGTPGSPGKVLPAELTVLQNLCRASGTSASVADRIANGLQQALAGLGSVNQDKSNVPLLPQTLAQLSWLGIESADIQRLAPYIVLLPRHTPVNLNTAPREVIAAVVPGLDLGSAERLVQARQRAPFKTTADAQAQLAPNITLPMESVGVGSDFFEVRGRLRLSDRVLEESSLVMRDGTRSVKVLTRQRENSRDAAS